MKTNRRMSTHSDAIRRLRALASDPQAQAEYAYTLLDVRTRRDELMAALEVVAGTPVSGVRSRLLVLYDYFAAQDGKRDRGAYVRSALLKALRPLVEPDDRELLLAAVTTYEYLPPAFDDAAGPLRAAGLIALNELDDELGRYHAVRLLADRENTEKMSGEPAITAAQALGVQHELTPLFLYAMGPAHPDYGEVMAECLRQLTAMPSAMVPSLIERHGGSDDAIVLLGLFDLLFGSPLIVLTLWTLNFLSYPMAFLSTIKLPFFLGFGTVGHFMKSGNLIYSSFPVPHRKPALFIASVYFPLILTSS